MNRPDFLKVSRKDLLTYMMCSPQISWSLWAVLIMGLFLSFIGVLADWKILILGLIICFTVVPTVAFFIYFSNLIDSHIMINILPHTVESRPGGYLVRIYRPDFRQDGTGEDEKEKDPGWVETGKMTIFETNVLKRSETNQFSILHLVNSPVKVLYIPKNLQAGPVACEIHSDHITVIDE